METDVTSSEQEKQLDLKTRIQNLRAEGKTYRQIAEIERVSISQISRILRNSNQQPSETVNKKGEMAAKVFQLLEEGRTLPQVVIKMKFEPEVVQDLYNKWFELKQIDVNEPTLGKLTEKLQNHIFDHQEIQNLFQAANGAGDYRRHNCANANKGGECQYSKYLDEKNAILHCAFCIDFKLREDLILDVIVEPQYPPWYQSQPYAHFYGS